MNREYSRPFVSKPLTLYSEVPGELWLAICSDLKLICDVTTNTNEVSLFGPSNVSEPN